METVERDMVMGDIISKFPSAVPIMLEYGLHCVGCHVNAFETLEQGAKGHGMPEEEIQEMLERINNEVKKNKVDVEGRDLVLTPKAVEKIKEFQEKMNKQGQGLRVEVIPGGCSGQTYAMDFDKEATEADEVIEQDGVKVFIVKEDLQLIKGSKIDYLDSLQGAGFRVDNPNAHESCGCGKSFN